MKITRQEYIEYSNGTLSEARQEAIEQYLEQHPLEKRALEGFMSSHNSKKESLDSLLNKIDQKIDARTQATAAPVQQNKSRVLPIKLLMSAASIAAIGLLLFFMLPSTSNDGYQLQDYFDTYPDVLSNQVRGVATESNIVNIRDGMFAYTIHDFSKASTLLSSIAKDQEGYEAAKFYSAIAYLGKGDAKTCSEILERMSAKEYPFTDGIQWYLALSYVELGEKEKAKSFLQAIVNTEHYKQEEATKLLASL